MQFSKTVCDWLHLFDEDKIHEIAYCKLQNHSTLRNITKQLESKHFTITTVKHIFIETQFKPTMLWAVLVAQVRSMCVVRWWLLWKLKILFTAWLLLSVCRCGCWTTKTKRCRKTDSRLLSDRNLCDQFQLRHTHSVSGLITATATPTHPHEDYPRPTVKSVTETWPCLSREEGRLFGAVTGIQ